MDLGFTTIKNLCGKEANAYAILLMEKTISNRLMETVQGGESSRSIKFLKVTKISVNFPNNYTEKEESGKERPANKAEPYLQLEPELQVGSILNLHCQFCLVERKL